MGLTRIRCVYSKLTVRSKIWFLMDSSSITLIKLDYFNEFLRRDLVCLLWNIQDERFSCKGEIMLEYIRLLWVSLVFSILCWNRIACYFVWHLAVEEWQYLQFDLVWESSLVGKHNYCHYYLFYHHYLCKVCGFRKKKKVQKPCLVTHIEQREKGVINFGNAEEI